MTTGDNLTAVLYKINDIRLEQRPIPEPKCNQVLLQMEVVGICGSDVHYYEHGKVGPFVVENPMVIGHEASGTVVKCGENVKTLKPGDRVAIEPGVPCRQCYLCKIGKYHLCPDMKFCATPPIDGNLSRFYCQDEDFCFKLPCNMDLEEGTLMEPLAVGVHACKQAEVKIGDVCLIFGSGPIGLSTLVTAKAMGASKVMILDVREERLQLAKQMGADSTLKVDTGMSEDSISDKIKQCLGDEPHACFDCTGNQMCCRIALNVARAGGVVVIVGMGETEMTLPLTAAMFKEVKLKGSFRYANDYQQAIEMVRTGRVNVKPLITHHFRLEDTVKAFETARDRIGNPVKIMIHANPKWTQ
ncbi:sorbitol dehydrogenase [Leptinotarsa decemlineata]|uniref:sorbitol dehydrogenase n=1 Tax=Leptinotarsa decemlineata TaxID=7539 RepID=UPI003D30D23F